MIKWSPQFYSKVGVEQGIEKGIINNAIAVANQIAEVNPRLPLILTLNHLAVLSDTKLSLLRLVVSRELDNPYSTFQLRKGMVVTKSNKVNPKHGRGFRTICVPSPVLMSVQKWISENILCQIQPHEASSAYMKGSQIIDAAKIHCGCSWMIKMDVRNFFESISEKRVYKIFREQGYQPLVAFELARICTRVNDKRGKSRVTKHYGKIPFYQNKRLGYLPQGAPTSPMLSNLAMKEFDEKVMIISSEYGLFYTRYADDICLSISGGEFTRAKASEVIKKVYSLMNYYELSPNLTKTRVVPPSARKQVLGLLVDRDTPRLSREFRAKLRQHIYFITHPDVGPVEHARNRGFTSVFGLRNHVEGLIAYASQINKKYGNECKNKLKGVKWPF